MDILDTKSMEHILVRSTNWIGDAVMTLPALQALHQHFPAARISVLVKPWVAPIFENHPAVDALILYDSEHAHKGLIGKWRLSAQLRARHIDLAVLFQNAFEAAWIPFWAGIPRRAGYAVQLRGGLLTHGKRPRPEIRARHQVHYYLDLLRQLGIAAAVTPPRMYLTTAEMAEARESLRNLSGSDKTVWLAFCPGAQYGTAKQWLPERFAALGKRLLANHDLQILILGSQKERAVGEALADTLGPRAVSLCGQTGLRQAAALIAQCRAMVTNDSGLMHVAAALQIPQVVIIGPTNPVATGPYGSSFQLAHSPVACAPCKHRDCPIDHRCMQRVTVDMVYDALQTLTADGS